MDIKERSWNCQRCGSANILNQHLECPKCGSARFKFPLSLPQGKIGIFLGLGGLLLSFSLGAFYFRGAGTIAAVVKQANWERAIAIEKQQSVTEEGWSVPEGGRIISQKQVLEKYEQVIDRYETAQRQVTEKVKIAERSWVCGKRDFGNGDFQNVKCTEPIYETRTKTETYQKPIYQQKPIYRTKYAYEIVKWTAVRAEKATGDRQTPPHWPDVKLAANERAVQQSEVYAVEFADSQGKSYRLQLDRQQWENFAVGQKRKLRVKAAGDRVEVLSN